MVIEKEIPKKTLTTGIEAWIGTHHTTRKSIEMALYAFIASCAAALLADPLIWSDVAKWYVPVGMALLYLINNWARHNLGQK